MSALKREVSKLKMSLKDRDGDVEQKEAQIAALKESLLKAQEKHTEKAKVNTCKGGMSRMRRNTHSLN